MVPSRDTVGLTFYARTCGWTLARAHARSDRSPSPSTSATTTRSTNSITDFSERYANQNERDYQQS